MGFLIQTYTLMDIPLSNVYLTIKGRYSIQNNSFMYGAIPNRYQIYADYWFSLGKDKPSIQSSSIIINTDNLPEDIYFAIYETLKIQLSANSDTPLCFTNE